jgi:hypothetical protein
MRLESKKPWAPLHCDPMTWGVWVEKAPTSPDEYLCRLSERLSLMLDRESKKEIKELVMRYLDLELDGRRKAAWSEAILEHLAYQDGSPLNEVVWNLSEGSVLHKDEAAVLEEVDLENWLASAAPPKFDLT